MRDIYQTCVSKNGMTGDTFVNTLKGVHLTEKYLD